MAVKNLGNPVTRHEPVVILGAGAWYIDRYHDNGGVRGAEQYVGDTVAAEISATVQRTSVFSGDGAVASKLIDKVTQIDRTLGITPQDATLDNMALFLIASKPAEVEERAAADLVTVFNVPEDATDRHYFQLGASATDPAGRPAFKIDKDTPIVLATGFQARDIGASAARAAVVVVDGDYELDLDTGRLRFTAGGLKKFRGKDVEVTVASAKAGKAPAFGRVKVESGAGQVRVAARYIEEPDEGAPGRNIYIPQASISPAGAASLKSRDTAQQWPLSLAVEDPGGDLAGIYIDGVPL